MNPRLIPTARLARSILRTQSDERLAELAAAGSDAAFEALVARHRRSLVRRCARVVGPTDAEEATQDALLRALAALRRGDEVRRVAPWLHAIAHNTALNVRRSQAAHAGDRTGPLDGADAVSVEDRSAAGRAQLREVVAALGDLPDRQREAIVMRELEGRSYAEIADRLESSPGAVRQLLHRARAGMRDRVGGLPAWEPLLRWASSGGAGGRLGALPDACLAGVKVCAAVVPALALGAGGLGAGGLGAGGLGAGHRPGGVAHRTVAVPRAVVRHALTRAAVTSGSAAGAPHLVQTFVAAHITPVRSATTTTTTTTAGRGARVRYVSAAHHPQASRQQRPAAAAAACKHTSPAGQPSTQPAHPADASPQPAATPQPQAAAPPEPAAPPSEHADAPPPQAQQPAPTPPTA